MESEINQLTENFSRMRISNTGEINQMIAKFKQNNKSDQNGIQPNIARKRPGLIIWEPLLTFKQDEEQNRESKRSE